MDSQPEERSTHRGKKRQPWRRAVPGRGLGTLREQEIRLIRETLEWTGWNKHQAARLLGITRSTLYSKIRRYRIVASSARVDSSTAHGDGTP